MVFWWWRNYIFIWIDWDGDIVGGDYVCVDYVDVDDMWNDWGVLVIFWFIDCLCNCVGNFVDVILWFYLLLVYCVV